MQKPKYEKELTSLLKELNNVCELKQEHLDLIENFLDNLNMKEEKFLARGVFTKEEILKMPKEFRKELLLDRSAIKANKRKVSKYAWIYEIRFRRLGYNIYACGKKLEAAKAVFLERLKTAEKKLKPIVPKTRYKRTPRTFHSFAMFYFENFRKRKVAEITMARDLNAYKNHLKPYFQEKPLLNISAIECQDLLDKLISEGKEKTAETIHSLMNVIFKAALAHSLIIKNPLDIIYHEKHERKHGRALTKEEEKILLNATKGTEYQLMYAIILFTGMRPCEYSSAKREGNFIVCKNCKRKHKKIEYKKIPITPKLKPYIKNEKHISFYSPETLRAKFKTILPNHILYDLRTTFYTRCLECNITEVARKLFVGHSLGELANTYTDLPDEYLLKEGKKFKY